MAHIIHAFNLPCIRSHYRRKALVRRLHHVFFVDFINACFDSTGRYLGRKEF